MPNGPEIGADYLYQPDHGQGFGAVAKGDDLTAEMHELDLKPGAAVTVHAIDEDTGWPIVQWMDDVGIERLTTIDPEVFTADFQAVSEGA